MALLLVRMVAEEIVMEAEGNQPQISEDQSGIKKIKRGAWLHRAYFLDLLLKTNHHPKRLLKMFPAAPWPV
jgi:hypothetical protein